MSVSDKLEAIAPELSAVPSERRLAVIGMAENQVGTIFGDMREDAVAYLAAHMMTLGNRGGSSGPVTAKTEGSLSMSFAAPSNGNGYEATSYGQEFLRLRRLVTFGPRTRCDG